MVRLLVALDQAVGVPPTQFVQLWAGEQEAAVLGTASVESASDGALLPELMELVVIPLEVNLAATALYELVRKLVRRGQPHDSSGADLEVVEVQTQGRDRVVVVRLRDHHR